MGNTKKNTTVVSVKSNKENKKTSISKSSSIKKKSIKQESKTLVVKIALKYFILTYNKKRVAIKGYQMDLSLDRKKCNAHILDRFNKEIIQITEDVLKEKEMKTTNEKKEIDTVEIQVEGKSYFVKFASQIGQTLLNFPKEILRMKWEEKFNCTKKKK